MIDYATDYEVIKTTPLAPWIDSLPIRIEDALNSSRWGDYPKWLSAINALPAIKPSSVDLNSNSIRIGENKDCDDAARSMIERYLRQMHPWRKGPFDVFGVHIETEWRSDFKWDRLKEHIQPLKDRLILDVGCGSGYHCWRMIGQEARMAIGIDPTLLYVMQFHAMQKYINRLNAAVFPLGIDDMPEDLNRFDTVFSMGLLYHRRSPLDHLLQLRSLLREGGELVLETLVIDGEAGQVLTPQGRYAKMPNVWFIPSPLTLEGWLKRCGFKNVRLVSINQTTSEEQRATGWMGFESLIDFLDPRDRNLTVEGYPAPKRAIFLADNS